METLRKTRTRLTKAEQAHETREALLDAGEHLFGKRGYLATMTEDVVESAAVTRGALQHHFVDKRGLFLAVVNRISQRVLEEVVAASSQEGLDARQVIELGCLAYLDLCTDSEVNKILFQDAPSVLTSEEMNRIPGSAGSGLLVSAIEDAIGAGKIDVVSAESLACVLLGALSCAGLEIARSEDPAAAHDSYAALLSRLLDGLRPEQKSKSSTSRNGRR